MRAVQILDALQDYYLLSAQGLAGLVRRPFYFGDTVKQMDRDSVGGSAVVLLLTLFVGMAFSLQLAAELKVLGLQSYMPKIVGISVIREIGPVFVALIFAGRAGAGMASELGSMVLGHQVDTLRVFGVDPVKKLVTPRLLSSLLMLPVLTVLGDSASLLGSLYIAVTVAGGERGDLQSVDPRRPDLQVRIRRGGQAFRLRRAKSPASPATPGSPLAAAPPACAGPPPGPS